ncbi:hypothetical protein I0C86_13165 [Plantactinospora sp. S1510]|uniref:Uncharacterized protein n=1 Tax=Plantactinospora alkalitolerans TaxID=2789879 RepID=A0ABS0GUL5_9ACTN|nr:hypothetical protein [Plantactinospora alkalitolerans]MBF9129905.1 hypothetical protein [Plantactinospora alkalitolerans]
MRRTDAVGPDRDRRDGRDGGADLARATRSVPSTSPPLARSPVGRRPTACHDRPELGVRVEPAIPRPV